MHDPESFHIWDYEVHGSIAIPSPESPLERFLTPNWTEDANNLYARLHMRDLNVRFEGLSLAETRQAIATAMFHQAMRNVRGASSSPSSRIAASDPPVEDERR